MRVLLFTATLVWLSTATRGQDAQDTLEKVQAGVDATNAIIDVLRDEKFSKTFSKIGEIAGKMGPFLGAIGPAISLVSIFLPQSPSPELQLMKKEFAKVDAKFDQVFTKFAEVENLIEKTSLKNQYAQFEHTILSLSTRLREFLGANTADVSVYKRSFIREYESSYRGATFKIWNGVVEDTRVLSNNIPLTAMDFFDNDRKKVQGIMKGVLNLILQGVKVELAYLKAKELNHDYNVKKSDWQRKISQLVSVMKKHDRTVKNRWYSQIKTDIPQKLAEWHGRSNSDFANRLYNFLNSKFDWRDWHVVTYNDLHGGQHHYVKWCSGVKYFRTHGRNLVVASVDDRKSPINRGEAYAKLGSVSTRRRKTGFWGSRKTVDRKADDIWRNTFPKEFKTGCTYASAGVIKKSAGIAHRAPGNRLAVRDNNKYKLHVFG